MAFRLPLMEKQWTKKDTFILLNADDQKIVDTAQVLATFILIKKSSKSIKFLEEYRDSCQDERIVSDLDNQLGQDNHPDFITHRHDQSVFSILAKKSSIVQIEGDLSDYGFFPRQYLKGKTWLHDDFCKNIDNYKFQNFVISNRKANPITYLIKFTIKRFLYSIKLYKRC
jgi:hypothetical protein